MILFSCKENVKFGYKKLKEFNTLLIVIKIFILHEDILNNKNRSFSYWQLNSVDDSEGKYQYLW